MLPKQEPPLRSSFDFAPASPPNQDMMHNGQRPSLRQTSQENLLPYQQPMDPRNSSATGFMNDNGAVPVPNGPHPQMPNGGSRHGATMSMGGFDVSRSPPAAKNTSHVPCKFFRSGQCQAGRACPFSHALDTSSADTPCKYFAKGNCKFGQKCALAHIMPDGRRANRASMMTNSNNVVVGPRIDPQFYQPSDPLPIQPLLAQQSDGMPPHFNFQRPILLEPEPPLQDGYISRPSDQMLPKDTGFISQPDSKYGSPREDTRYLSLSPSARLSVLDAPLPASFDSQGISYMARHGPVAASLPSKMGVFESSPPASLPKKSPMPLDSISNIGSSGPASREHRSRGPDLGSSPFGSGDEGFGPRFMHSRRTPKPKLLSTSMPRVDIPIEDSDDDAFHFSGGEEDYIPTSIHDQVLTHDEQQRRYSRTEQDRRAVREALSGINTPNDPSSKVGSPTVGSPSRYGPLFARQQQHQQQQYNNNEISSNLATSPSAFGHVGSPLRNSSLHPNASPSFRASKAPGDISPSFPSLSSPPRQSSMSVLSQQLSRTRLSSRAEAAFSAAAAGDNASTPKPTAYYPVPPTSSISTSNIAATAHRNISNSSSSQGGSRSTDRIEEEPVDGVFSMEDDFEDHQRKRHSGGNSIISNQAQPPAWSAVVAAASPPGAGFGKGPSRPAATSRTRATQGTGNGSGPVGTRKGGGS